ncbi:MAG TPA: NCS2 family permease [Candidatus Omnitrophota bacterium]|nr:NCS2 family permease [Candidatus Omnitrophota bacterium]
MLSQFFKFQDHQTHFRQEVLAGLTTFLTMAYIIFVQPAVLSKDFLGQATGIDPQAVLLATCLAAAFGSIVMGLYANYPIALAPGMGENFFFVSTVVALTGLGMANAWQVALGIVFISGCLFFFLSVLRLREMIINALSPSLRNAIAVGIGLFITFIGFQNAQIIIAKPGTMVGLNTHFTTPAIVVFTAGMIATAVLQIRKVRGAILWGIGTSSVVALCLGQVQYNGFWGLPQITTPAAFRMDLIAALSLKCLPFIFVFLFMDVFDTIGTLMGVAETAGFVKDNTIPRVNKVLIVDSAATVVGACLGTSTVTSYIESAAGVAYGGRTGLTSIVVGVLFLVALFFSPVIGMIGHYPPITACALVVVGLMMMTNITKIDWKDHSESVPSFLMIVGIPFCYSIADGLALGFISYPIINFLSGRGSKVSALMYIMAATLLLYFIFVRTHIG